ncbi:MAG: ATP-binding cassette domain-containing protein [Bacteroidales bacterium]|nr:ATP-binding cassette domain-containing protein [Bacteroidales bacterium]
MIQATGIHKQYGQHKVLDNVSLHVPRGSTFGLLGLNGAGKTTLLRILNRIIEPDAGTLHIDGTPLGQYSTNQIGYLPEERGLYPRMTVTDQLHYFARLKGMSRAAATTAIDHWLQHFSLTDTRAKTVGQLSKGTQQKLQLITALLHNPTLLVLDEPFSGLDPMGAQLLRETMAQLHTQGTTMILSTHNMYQAQDLCSHIAILANSHITVQGETAQLIPQGQSLQDYFITTFSISKSSVSKLPLPQPENDS